MATVIGDLLTFASKTKTVISTVYNAIKWVVGKLKFWGKAAKQIEQIAETVLPIPKRKPGIIAHVKYKMFPKAKLTYWLADEEVIVYVKAFSQKDKFKITFTEILTGRETMVNSAVPINYRLEELKPGDDIEQTVVQQDQHY